MKFSRDVKFADCQYFAFRGNKFGSNLDLFQTLTLGINFRGSQQVPKPVFHVRYSKGNSFQNHN